MPPMNTTSICPLCGHSDSNHYHTDQRRSYLLCNHCQLVFVPESQRLNADTEKAQYDLHNNDPSDTGYRTFLSRLAQPIAARVPPAASGLDFGSGPGPTLSLMLEEQGFNMSLYDPFYAPDQQVLTRQYDFITCSEAIEHFHQPIKEWKLWMRMLKPGGVLGIMTKLRQDLEAFSKWHYKLDPTHVSFFSQQTFAFLAETEQLSIEFIGKDVVIMRKPESGEI